VVDTDDSGWVVGLALVAFDADEVRSALVRGSGEDESVGAQQLVRRDEGLWVGDDEAGELEAGGPGVVKGEGGAGGQVGQEDVYLVAFGAGGEGVDEGVEELREGHVGS